MELDGALALVRSAKDELVVVRDAPAKGAGAVGCFARSPCVCVATQHRFASYARSALRVRILLTC
jgi:hypothetical protein